MDDNQASAAICKADRTWSISSAPACKGEVLLQSNTLLLMMVIIQLYANGLILDKELVLQLTVLLCLVTVSQSNVTMALR